MTEQPHSVDVLKGIGNANILGQHIQHFRERADKADLQDPNFYCWVLLSALQISNAVEQTYLRAKLGSKDASIKQLVQHIADEATVDHRHSLALALEIRHSFAHFGLPNIVRSESKMRDGVTRKELEEVLENHERLQDIFRESNEMLRSVKQPTVPIGRIGQVGL